MISRKLLICSNVFFTFLSLNTGAASAFSREFNLLLSFIKFSPRILFAVILISVKNLFSGCGLSRASDREEPRAGLRELQPGGGGASRLHSKFAACQGQSQIKTGELYSLKFYQMLNYKRD